MGRLIEQQKGNEYTDLLHRSLKRYGIDFATGVPCGAQKEIIYNLMNDHDILHVSATREAEAIGISAGAYLAGRRPIVYMQNSGLFDCANDIASLLMCYEIPCLLSVTWRGCPGEDTPQHIITGSATTSLLDSLGVSYEVLDRSRMDDILHTLFDKMEGDHLPTAMLIRKGWHK